MQPCPRLREVVLRTLGAATVGLSGQSGKEAASMSQAGGGHLGTPWRGQGWEDKGLLAGARVCN